jgi:hypothetical protein
MDENVIKNFSSDSAGEKMPMHPEDFVALLAWVRAKETGRDSQKNFKNSQ